MACDVPTVLADACTSGIAALPDHLLLVVLAQSLATGNAETMLEAACESGIAALPDKQLLVIIAQALCAAAP